MCEILGSVIGANAFSDTFDGFSNDLIKLVYGLGRDPTALLTSAMRQ